MQLRPNAFYELTDGCELIFADIRCQYFFGPPPPPPVTTATVEKEESCEQTQAYDLGGEEFDETEGEEDVNGKSLRKAEEVRKGEREALNGLLSDGKCKTSE